MSNQLANAVKRVRKNERLSHTEKLFYLFLFDICNSFGECHLTQRELGRETGLAYGSIGNIVSHLVETGYLTTEIETNSSGHEIRKLQISDYQAEESPQALQTNSSSTVVGTSLGNIKITIQIEEKR